MKVLVLNEEISEKIKEALPDVELISISDEEINLFKNEVDLNFLPIHIQAERDNEVDFFESYQDDEEVSFFSKKRVNKFSRNLKQKNKIRDKKKLFQSLVKGRTRNGDARFESNLMSTFCGKTVVKEHYIDSKSLFPHLNRYQRGLRDPYLSKSIMIQEGFNQHLDQLEQDRQDEMEFWNSFNDFDEWDGFYDFECC